MHFGAFAEVGESMLQPAKYFQNNTSGRSVSFGRKLRKNPS